MVTDKKMIDYIRKVAPGNPIRLVIDDLVRSGMGAMIVFENPEIYSEKMFEGGFKINAKFSSQKLFELCKMDGGIIVSSDLSKIMYANVLITPDTSISTNETGTRHKASERCAKQADTFVIAVSERRKKTTIYLDNSRYTLRGVGDLLRDVTANLQVLEEQRNSFNENLMQLDILELSEMVSAVDVCRIIQKAELMSRISEELKWQVIELGNHGKIINMRFRELTSKFERIESNLLRDYSIFSLKKTRVLLENLSFDDLLNLDGISELVLNKGLDENVSPKGYRLLSKIGISDKEVSQLVRHFGSLSNVMDLDEKKLSGIFRHNSGKVKDEMDNLREQILSGKRVAS